MDEYYLKDKISKLFTIFYNYSPTGELSLHANLKKTTTGQKVVPPG